MSKIIFMEANCVFYTLTHLNSFEPIFKYVIVIVTN